MNTNKYDVISRISELTAELSDVKSYYSRIQLSSRTAGKSKALNQASTRIKSIVNQRLELISELSILLKKEGY